MNKSKIIIKCLTINNFNNYYTHVFVTPTFIVSTHLRILDVLYYEKLIHIISQNSSFTLWSIVDFVNILYVYSIKYSIQEVDRTLTGKYFLAYNTCEFRI